jgi:hypothetical protein
MAGSMERPARFLAILSTFVGLGLCGIALTRQLGGTPAAAGLLALGSLPWFWDSAVGIGTDAPLFCVTAATSLVVFGKRTGVLAAMLFTAILIAAWGIWPSLWMAACPIIAWGVALVWTKLSRAQSMGITAVLLAAMLILVFGSRGESNAAHVERLDWIRTHVDSRATLMIHGQGRHIIRYYQTAHHRTGHPTLEVDPNTDFAALAQRLYLERHPLLVVLGCSESLDAALGRHFGGEDIHDGVRIYRLGQ